MAKNDVVDFENSTQKVGALIPADWNPRKLNRKAKKDLEKSLKKFNLAEVPVVNLDGLIVAGHQRIKILHELYGPEHEIDVRVPVRMMTDEEVKQYNIVSNRVHGDFDHELLDDHFDKEDLLDWGFDEGDFKEDDEKGESNPYTAKVESPVYEIKGEKPEIEELAGLEKVNELISKIDQSDVSPELKKFLTLGAYRHIVFDYEKIAEFYAHADKGTQELMEQSALVIVDFNKAIEGGFLDLNKELTEAYLNNHPVNNAE